MKYKRKILLLLHISFGLSSCININDDLLNKSSSLTNNSSESIILPSIELEYYDYIPLIDNAWLRYGSGFSSAFMSYDTSEEVAPINEFFNGLKFVLYEKNRSTIPFADSLNVESMVNSNSYNVYYEVTSKGEVYLKNYDVGREYYISTTKVDYMLFFELFYAEWLGYFG